MYVPVVTEELSFGEKVNRLRLAVKESRRAQGVIPIQPAAGLDANRDYEASLAAQIVKSVYQSRGKGVLLDVWA